MLAICHGRAIAKDLVHLLERAAAGLRDAEEYEYESGAAEGGEKYVRSEVGGFDQWWGDETLRRWQMLAGYISPQACPDLSEVAGLQ